MSYNEKNIFAKIINGEIPCNKVYEDDSLLAFHDIQKAATVHILLIPKQPYTSFNDFTLNAQPETIAHFFKTAQHIAQQYGLTETGYRLVTNHGADAMQTVPHFHLHILGKAKLGHFGSNNNDREHE